MTFSDMMTLTSTISSPTAFSDDELQALYGLCMKVDSKGIVVEIGCQLGRSSSMILQCAKERGFSPIFIDPWTAQPDYAAKWHKMAWEINTPHAVLQMRTDEALVFISWWEGIDLLLIDGDHTEAGVKTDTRMADEVLPGGVLAVHDVGSDLLPDVSAVIDRYAVEPRWTHLGVFGTLGTWRRNT